MRTLHSKGDSITITAPTGGLESNDVVGFGTFIGVAISTTPAGEEAALATVGVHELPAESGTGTGMVIGELVYWDETEGEITKDSTGNDVAGICYSDKAVSGVSVLVKIDAR